jgi:hypothetical protein
MPLSSRLSKAMVSLTISHVLYDKYALASSNVQRHFDLVQSNIPPQ